jgi:hypothetical protein
MTTAAGVSPSFPGFGPLRESTEAAVTSQNVYIGDVLFADVPVISSTSSDAGNTPTYSLRPGLLMARLDADDTWVPYDNDATDGSQCCCGVLNGEVNMRDYTTGSDASRYVDRIIVKAHLNGSALINLDYQARRQLKMIGCTFNDEATYPAPIMIRRVKAVTTATTLTAKDNGTRIVSNGAGALIHTLPTLAVGLFFEFLNIADQTMTITSAAGDDIVANNDASADSVAGSTASNLIGFFLRVEAHYCGATLKWVRTPSLSAQTVAT